MDVPRSAGERALAFTHEELEKPVPLYGRLYSRPEVQVSTHQKRAHWHAIAKEVQTLGVYNRQSTHCRKRSVDLRLWAQKISEVQLRKSSELGRCASRALTPLMQRILAVVYPYLDRHLKAAQQSQGASTSGEGAEALASGKTAAHGSSEAETMDAQGTSGWEGEGASTGEATTTGSSDSETSSDGGPPAVADTSG
ncbi:hypothetical protein NDU88_005753 [Pleurodeles waltl]|uniref:Uncharacterized protein n=1 Tax=Pleurodeles waltl TaxID=8319 RepID=A0AAV7UL05_PLEWA|nr:hypothetical protein NDU88_005753 [Pleurodeles waltl]